MCVRVWVQCRYNCPVPPFGSSTAGSGGPAPAAGGFGSPAPAATFGAGVSAPTATFGAGTVNKEFAHGFPVFSPQLLLLLSIVAQTKSTFGNTSGNLFGAAPAAAGFGAAAPAPAGFGAAAPAPAPAPPAGAFGGFGSPAAGGFGFGSPAPAPAPAPFGAGFGSPAPAPAPFGGGFGAPAGNPNDHRQRLLTFYQQVDLFCYEYVVVLTLF